MVKAHLILQYNDMLQLHNLNRSQMLTRLRLRARLISRYQQKCSIHNRSAGQHGAHQDVVARAVDERHMPQQSIRPLTSFPLTRRIDFLLTLERAIACRPRTLLVVTLIDLRIRISEFDSDVSF